jgi:hypothetical protein
VRFGHALRLRLHTPAIEDGAFTTSIGAEDDRPGVSLLGWALLVADCVAFWLVVLVALTVLL